MLSWKLNHRKSFKRFVENHSPAFFSLPWRDTRSPPSSHFETGSTSWETLSRPAHQSPFGCWLPGCISELFRRSGFGSYQAFRWSNRWWCRWSACANPVSSPGEESPGGPPGQSTTSKTHHRWGQRHHRAWWTSEWHLSPSACLRPTNNYAASSRKCVSCIRRSSEGKLSSGSGTALARRACAALALWESFCSLSPSVPCVPHKLSSKCQPRRRECCFCPSRWIISALNLWTQCLVKVEQNLAKKNFPGH